MCVVTVACIVPWTVRNRVVLGDWAAISTSSLGHALWYGSYPEWDLEFRGWDEPPLDTLLAGRDWLVGSEISLADIAVFAQMYCIRGADEGAKLIEARPAVAAWMERVDRATAKPES